MAAKIVTPPAPAPAFTLALPAHVDAVDVNNLDCQTRDIVGSALGCGFEARDGVIFAADGRSFRATVVGRDLVLT